MLLPGILFVVFLIILFPGIWWNHQKYKGKPECKVFISYSSEDRDFVEKLVNELQMNGIRVIWDDENLENEEFLRFIEDSVRKTDYTIFVASKNSLQSPYCYYEFLVTLEHEKVRQMKKLVPIQLDKVISDSNALSVIENSLNSKIENYEKRKDNDKKFELLKELKNNFNKVLSTLEGRHVRHFTNEKFSENLRKLLRQLGINQYDCLLAYNDSEKKEAKVLYNKLSRAYKDSESRNFKVWYRGDLFWQQAEKRSQEELSRIKISKSIGIIVGLETDIRWGDGDWKTLVGECKKDRKVIIFILLKGVKDIPKELQRQFPQDNKNIILISCSSRRR